jgi:hypothetical protein
MARRSNTYPGASGVTRGSKASARPKGRLGRLRGGPSSWFGRLRRHREFVILAVLGLGLALGLGSLAGAWVFERNDRDWTAVASVNGHAISREALRSRMNVLELLAQQRAQFVREQATGGRLSAAEAQSLLAEVQASVSDPITAARESLIDDEYLRQLAARDGVATPPAPDPWAEATAFASSDFAQRVRYVRFGLPGATGSAGSPTAPGASPSPSPGASTAPASSANPWPAASSSNVDATTARLRSELAAGTAVTVIVAGLHDAGWQVLGADTAVSEAGTPADSTLELDRSIAAQALRGKANDTVGPTTDLYGRVAMGKLLSAPDTSHLQLTFASTAEAAKVDEAAMQSWADGRALRRAIAAHLLANWTSGGVLQAHLRELVIGDAPTSSGSGGPWVELSGLMLDPLSSIDPASIAGAPAGLDLHPDALAKTLRGLAPAERSSLWRALVAAANRTASSSGQQSGEIGFATKDGLAPDVGKAAFDEKVRSGDVLGPITTSAGPELFLVESRYSGALDDRSKIAIAQVRSDAAANPTTYTSQFSPADGALAVDAGWRAEAEFSAADPAHSAIFDTPIGILSDPMVLDGKLALALVDQRLTVAPDERMLDRLHFDGFDAWFATELAKATITRSDNPLPELMPSPTPTPTASPLPSMPGIETPNLPSIPGLPVPTPVKTDAFGLPEPP